LALLTVALVDDCDPFEAKAAPDDGVEVLETEVGIDSLAESELLDCVFAAFPSPARPFFLSFFFP